MRARVQPTVTGMAEHMPPDTGQMTPPTVYQSHILRATEMDTMLSRATWGLHQELDEHPIAVGGRLCSVRRIRSPLVSPGKCDWLV